MFGCFSNHVEYIGCIVLPNGRDFNQYYTRDRLTNASEFGMDVFRYFVNAIESMNNIIDYIYFDNYDELVERVTLRDFRTGILHKHLFMSELNDLANAYKHSVRAATKDKKTIINKGKIKAADMNMVEIKTELTISAAKTSSTTKITSHFRVEYYDIFLENFEYWLEYFMTGNRNAKLRSILDVGLGK
ncbi:hypothetical protein [Aeromonas dhakensis]|uniref:hypothetical protein n=1 Tax=Aeromonas dhakensis TaxID=196024 RepID=UPI0013DA146E|nr:hypothetical protein [Aeromonas dhakensis]